MKSLFEAYHKGYKQAKQDILSHKCSTCRHYKPRDNEVGICEKCITNIVIQETIYKEFSCYLWTKKD